MSITSHDRCGSGEMRLWPIGEKRAARVVAAVYGTGLRARRAQRSLAAYLKRARPPSSIVVDAIWDAWLADPNDVLWDLLRHKGGFAFRHGSLSMAILSEDAPAAWAIVRAAAREGHPVAAMARERILAFSANQEFINEVHACALDEPAAATFCAQYDLVPVPPADPVPRAAFLLAHRLYDRYLTTDPDGSLLAHAYQDGRYPGRSNIRRAMTRYGDLELIRTVVGDRPRVQRSHPFPYELREEVGYLGERYAEHGQWDRRWRLTLDAPLEDAVALARHFTGWSPPDDAGRALLGRLAATTPEAIREAGNRLLAARRIDLDDYFEPPAAVAFAWDDSRIVMSGIFTNQPPRWEGDLKLHMAFDLPSGRRTALGRPSDVPLLAQVGDYYASVKIPDDDAGHGESCFRVTRGVPYRRGYLVRGHSRSRRSGAWISWNWWQPTLVTPGELGLPENLAGWPLDVEITTDLASDAIAAYGPRLLIMRDDHGMARARETDLGNGATVNAVFCGPGRLISLNRDTEKWKSEASYGLRCWRREGDLLVPVATKPNFPFSNHLIALPEWEVAICGRRWFTVDALQEIEAPYGLGLPSCESGMWTSPDGTYLAVRPHGVDQQGPPDVYQPHLRRLRGGGLEIYDMRSTVHLRLLRAPMGDATPADLDALDALDGITSEVIDLLRACLRYRFP